MSFRVICKVKYLENNKRGSLHVIINCPTYQLLILMNFVLTIYKNVNCQEALEWILPQELIYEVASRQLEIREPQE
jgi:hypothetical protein